MKNLRNIDYDYLTGLIEGNGSIYIPKLIEENGKKGIDKTIKKYPSIKISFHIKNISLAENIKKLLNFGSVYKDQNKNACVYSIDSKEGIIKTIEYLNGRFKTPKINTFNKLIKFINWRDNLKIEELPINNSK